VIKASSGDENKGWFAGPWNSSLPCPIGFANAGVDDLHRHDEMFEVYLVSRGSSVALVDGESVDLSAGDMLCVEPGEAHTFTRSSEDYFHFVVQTPFRPGDKVTLDGA